MFRLWLRFIGTLPEKSKERRNDTIRGKGTVLLSVTITQESNRQIVILVGGGGGKGLLEDTVYGSVDDLIGTARMILIKQGFVQC